MRIAFVQEIILDPEEEEVLKDCLIALVDYVRMWPLTKSPREIVQTSSSWCHLRSKIKEMVADLIKDRTPHIPPPHTRDGTCTDDY